jgi:chaperonin GroES
MKKSKKQNVKKKASSKKVVKTAAKVKTVLKKVSGAENKTGIMPLGERVLVKPIASETTTSFGIIIPDSIKEKPETGVVVAVGPGKKSENGSTHPMSVGVGDKVMFSKYGFDEIKVAGETYYLINESNILAILN